MALKKSTLDISALQGLDQRTDPRRLPLGRAASAVNFIKNKEGRLEKRLGVSPLNANTVTINNSGFLFNRGLSLGTWSGNAQAIGQGLWQTTNATVTALESYLDDTAAMVVRGLVPDFTVRQDQIISNTPSVATSPTSVYYIFAGQPFEDYLVTVWIAIGATGVGTTATVWWCATNPATGSILVPPQALDTTVTHVTRVRLAIVGTTFICCYTNSTTNNIYCKTLRLSALQTAGNWTAVGAIVTANTSAGSGAFDMRAVVGDSTNFVLTYSLTSNYAGVVVEKRAVLSPGTIAAQRAIFQSGPPPGPTGGTTVAYGLRAGTDSGRIAVAFVNQPSAAAFQIWVATVGYPALSTSTPPVSIYTGLSTAENAPAFVEVAYCGSSGSLFGNPTHAVNFSFPFGCWNFGNSYLANGSPDPSATLVPDGNAAIVTSQFYETSGTLIGLSNSSNANVRVTAGVTLASRCLEANGLFYVVGWIPSNTQGGFVVLAADWSAGPGDGLPTTNPYPMRPVASLQTRTALANPSMTGSGPPNGWTGGSEWTYNPNDYSAHVSYVGSTKGERLTPATGQLGLIPESPAVYGSTQFGTLMAVSGGMPTVFDGANLFEQAFLWTPESIAISLGSPGGSGPTWTSATDSYAWIFTYEQFDTAGNFHISGRSPAVTLNGSNAGWTSSTLTLQPTFTIPTLGVTMRQFPTGTSVTQGFISQLAPPSGPVTIGCYRTVNNGSVFFRINDRFFNGIDNGANNGPTPYGIPNVVVNDWTSLPSSPGRRGTAVTFQDNCPDSALQDGSHPLLYGDGTNGAPGSLDNFCPPATTAIVRHKERLFVARYNLVMFTKARGELEGPGFNEQVNAFYVGGDDPVIAMASMDDKLIILKSAQLYYVSGDGPADDGSGNGFSPPQPIATDVGCVDPRSVQSTPEGVYYMSKAGLRLLSRNLAVSYVGGPVESELATNTYVTGAVLHPSANKVYFLANTDDVSQPLNGEVLIRDYTFDAWTTMVVMDGETQKGFISATVGYAPRTGQFNTVASVMAPVLHLMTSDGVVWRENDPALATPYYDNATYVQSSWTSPWIKPASTSNGLTSAGDQNWSRIWQTMIIGQSMDAHGIQFNYAIDYSGLSNTVTWTWSTPNTSQIAPNGVQWTPITQLSSYIGSRGESFLFQVIDVVDPQSVTGQGLQLLGLTCTIGTYDQGGYRLPQGARQ
jgi:hypothetical protein